MGSVFWPAGRLKGKPRGTGHSCHVGRQTGSCCPNNAATTMAARIRPEKVCVALLLVAILALVAFQRENIDVLLNQSWTARTGGNSTKELEVGESATRIPFELLSLGRYTSDDFANEAGVAPPFWKCSSSPCNTSSSTTSVRGPCYVSSRAARIDWERQANLSSKLSPQYHTSSVSASTDASDLADYCRPGFIIIGAGKCGTR
jgi:hypothetical protein